MNTYINNSLNSKKRSLPDDFDNDDNNNNAGNDNGMTINITHIRTMYTLWKTKMHNKKAVFELSFKKNPFKGEYTVFAGLEELLDIIKTFKFDNKQIENIKLNISDNEFIVWLKNIDITKIKISALKEGTFCFPNVPVLRIEGSLAVCHFLESIIVNTVRSSSLICTNAARIRAAVGRNKILFECNPVSELTSKYNFIGGYDGTTNIDFPVKLFKEKNIMTSSFVLSFDNDSTCDFQLNGKPFFQHVLECQKMLNFTNTNKSELIAFAAFACAFPNNFNALVDTYDTLKSGIPNFIIVASVLNLFGMTQTKSIQIDSGDLVYLSKEARKMFKQIKYNDHAVKIITTNSSIDENILIALEQQHEIDEFGIKNTFINEKMEYMYKIVELDSEPKMIASNEKDKVIIPAKKNVFRLYHVNDPFIDLLTLESETVPTSGNKVYCQDPYHHMKRIIMIPTRVEPLLNTVYENGKSLSQSSNHLIAIHDYVIEQLQLFRPDYLRSINPTPYKVSVSETLYNLMNQIQNKEMNISVLE